MFWDDGGTRARDIGFGYINFHMLMVYADGKVTAPDGARFWSEIQS
jgi:hypothetical protein